MAQKIQLKKEPRLDAKQSAFPFQTPAIDFVVDKEYSAIFYEQGLGKTKIAIDVALRWLTAKEVDTVLIVTKKGLVNNWLEEFAFHAFIKPKVLSSDRGKNYYVFNSSARIMITHYEAIVTERSRLEKFLKLRDVAIIVDESAKLKNPATKVTSTFLELAPLFVRRVIMTGTPVPNRPYDIWAQIFFLDGGKSLGKSYEEFKRGSDLTNNLYNDVVAQKCFSKALSEIFPKIKGFCIRETKEGSGLALPGKYYESVICEWEPVQFEKYEAIRMQEKYAVIRDKKLSTEDSEYTVKRLTRLLQVASNPFLIDETYSHSPGKLEQLLYLLRGAHSNGEKSIVWTSFVENATWIARQVKQYNPVVIYGGISDERRNSAISKFKNDINCEVLVAVPAAAKEGLTLTVANHVIFWDRSFSLDDYLQAQDRIHRISQKKDCYVTNLIMEDSIDIWVDSLLSAKALAAQLTQSDKSEEEYIAYADYSYGALIRDVLGIEEDENG